MDDPKKVFETSLAAFKAQASDRQIAAFTTTTIQHVQFKVITIQREQEKAKAMMNFNRFGMFFESLKQFDEITKALEIGIPDLSAFIWGPTNLLKLLDTNSWRRTFMANWKDYNGPFQSLLGTFDSHEKFLKRTLEDQQSHIIRETHHRVSDYVEQYQGDRDDLINFLDDYRRDREQLLANVEAQEIERKHRQYLDIIRWLHSPGVGEPEKDYHDQFLRVRAEYPETGKWILKEKEVRGWIEDEIPKHSALWIHGKKGAGKTILASLLINHLTKKKDSKTSYFYCRENDEKLSEQRFLAIMKSLLRQMVGHNRDLLPTLHERRLRGQEILNDENTAETLLGLFCETEMKQYIVIDGLDELSKIHRDRLVKFLLTTVAKSSDASPGKIRMLFLSTDLALMTKSLQSSDEVGEYCLAVSKTEKDIESYLIKQGSKLQEKFRELSDEDLKRAQTLTYERSNGMFLYAFLAIENLLEQPNLASLETELQDAVFPKDLEQAAVTPPAITRAAFLPEDDADMIFPSYGKIVERLRNTVHANTWKQAKKIFGWLAFAKRPLKLYELQAVLSISVDDEGRVQPLNTKKRLSEDIQEVCGSLVHMPGKTSIDFIHQTAKEHIMKSENLNGPALGCDLALLCLSYLSHTCFQENLQGDSRESFAKMGYYAFQDYAISLWQEHLKALVEELGDLFYDPQYGPRYRQKAFNTLQLFYNTYHKGLVALSAPQKLKAGETAEQARTHCRPFEQQEFYEHLLAIWTHVVRHQHQSLKERNKVSIEQLGEALKKIRGVLETLALQQDDEPALADSLKEFYGEKFFKCKRITCGYFYEGFSDEKAAKQHSNRHDRPYPCTVVNCSLVPFGFASNKDLDKHLRTYHPDESGQPSAFLPIDQVVVADANHQCELLLIWGCGRLRAGLVSRLLCGITTGGDTKRSIIGVVEASWTAVVTGQYEELSLDINTRENEVKLLVLLVLSISPGDRFLSGNTPGRTHLALPDRITSPGFREMRPHPLDGGGACGAPPGYSI
ncbi:hypothetical protein AK830_g426 [Neonectria ditissima]|uniref:Uncharacterized protein n=1 Tax=Neonectria ditissima TaxID=78410 RepID=A0A0P7BGV8_9HYPO|nr:hypothetical protein AK830_g426 [Neonectria ditissima]